MTYPATTYAEGVELTITSGNQLHEIINGSATEEINTESGMVPSVRKALADSMLFKPAIAWAEGSVESDPFQTRLYGEGIYWAPAASNETPISMGNNPTTDSNWFLAPVTGGESISRNTNLLSNHNFIIPSPDDITHPSVTPTDYVAGTQVFSGVFVGDDIVGLTYVDGRVSWTSGTLYFSVPNSGALEYVDQTEFIASVADFDGKPRTRGVSFGLVGDEYRITVTTDALEDIAANPTPLGSVKFEQGKVATGHDTQSLSARNLSDYTDIVYNSVADMIASTPPIGAICKTKGYYSPSDGGGAKYAITVEVDTDGYVDHSFSGRSAIQQCGREYNLLKCGAISGDNQLNENINANVYDAILAKHPPKNQDGTYTENPGAIIRVPAGTFVSSRSLKPTRGWQIIGISRKASVLKRVNSDVEIIDPTHETNSVVALIDTWIDIQDVMISGVGITVNPNVEVNGVHWVYTNSHVNLASVDIVGCFNALYEEQGLFMCTFTDVNIASNINGVNFSSNFGKTSLTFTSCYTSSHSGQPWRFVQTTYSNLISCGSDYDNSSNKDTEFGVYDFTICTMTLSNIGCESSHGNGIVRGKSSKLVINGITSFTAKTEFTPDASISSDLAVGPIVGDGSWNSFEISDVRIEGWQNNGGSTNQGNLLAFNSGVYDNFVYESQVIIKLYISPNDNDTVKGAGRISKSVMIQTDVYNRTKGIVLPVNLTGSGKTITLPVKPQGSANRKHLVSIKTIAGDFNGQIPRLATATFAFASLSSISNLEIAEQSNCTVTASGSNIIITMDNQTYDPLVAYEIISENSDLIDYTASIIS